MNKWIKEKKNNRLISSLDNVQLKKRKRYTEMIMEKDMIAQLY